MSVLIKGIKVHRGRCWECPCLDSEYGDCNVLEKDVHYITKEECPIMELPDHGDLIDRDAYRRATGMTEKCEKCSLKHYSSLFICPVSRECDELDKAPVVIPAERREE